MKKTLTAMAVVGLVLQANDALARKLDDREDEGAAFTGRAGEKSDGKTASLQGIRGAESYDHYIFTTSSSGTGAFGEWAAAGDSGFVGLSAADYICQLEASGAGLPNPDNYIAWVSDSQNDAYCRAHGMFGTKGDDCGASGGLPVSAGPWLRTDNQLFGGDLPGIVEDGEVYRPVDLNALASPFFSPKQAWTGTSADGTSSGFHCNDWTSSSSGDGSDLYLGLTGNTESTVINWTEDDIRACSDAARLTCLSAGSSGAAVAPPPPPYSASDRRAFVSSLAGPAAFSTWQLPDGSTPGDDGLGGLGAADEICQSLASAANLERPDQFKALLADTSTGLFERFDFQNRWYRVDNVKIVDGMDELFEPDENIQTAIVLDEQGLPVVEITDVWTGMDTQGTMLNDNCGDWTSTSFNDWSVTGSAKFSDLRLISKDEKRCGDPAHLYCFSDSDEISTSDFGGEGFYE